MSDEEVDGGVPTVEVTRSLRGRGPTDDEFAALMDKKAPNRDAGYNLPTEEQIAAAQEEGFATESVVVEEVEQEGEQTAEEAAAELTEEEEKLAFLRQKFKSPEELERAYVELESAYGARSQDLEEKRRVDAELAELKGRLGAYTEMQTATPQQAAPQITQETIDWLDTSVMENPTGTMEWVRTNQPALYERGIQLWGNLDPFSAQRYDNDLKLGAMQQEYEARLARAVAPVEAQTQQTMLETAYEGALREHPELAPYASDIETAAQNAPHLAKALSTAANVTELKGIIENLLYTAKGRRSDQAEAAIAGATEEQQAAAKTAKRRAAVTSPVSGGERVPKKADAAFKQFALEKPSTSVQDELQRSRDKAAKVRGR